MKAKIFTLIILAMITLTAIGYSYACWNGGFQINCYCNCDVKFTKVTYWDNEIEKDVASVYATLSCAKDAISVFITNSYPCYEAYVNFTITNKGNRPVHIDEVKIEEYNKTVLEIALTDIIACTWISPCESINGFLKVHTLQDAKECHTYTFKIKIKLSCQPRQHPRTVGFWKHQFASHLCKGGNPHIPADTLEQYLDEIAAKSNITDFDFTGTQKQKFQQALDILSPPRRSSMEAKLKAQLLALWLNYVAGWTEGWKVDGMTALEIIQGSEDALINKRTEEYEDWKDRCDRFNNLG